MLCFALYSASRATTQAYRRLLEPWGLTYPQYLVLVELWDRGELSVRELGDDLGLDSGTLSPLLKRMEAAGLVTRTRRADDNRVVVVAPTVRAEELRTEMLVVPAELIRCTGVTADGVADLVGRLHELTDRLVIATATDSPELQTAAPSNER